MKFLLEFIKTLLTRTGKTKGLNNQTKNEIVQMLTEANESVLKGNKKIDDQIENLKVEAFQSFFNTKKLRGIKAHIRHMERGLYKYKSKKMVLDHTSCEGVASVCKGGLGF